MSWNRNARYWWCSNQFIHQWSAHICKILIELFQHTFEMIHNRWPKQTPLTHTKGAHETTIHTIIVWIEEITSTDSSKWYTTAHTNTHTHTHGGAQSVAPVHKLGLNLLLQLFNPSFCNSPPLFPMRCVRFPLARKGCTRPQLMHLLTHTHAHTRDTFKWYIRIHTLTCTHAHIRARTCTYECTYTHTACTRLHSHVSHVLVSEL